MRFEFTFMPDEEGKIFHYHQKTFASAAFLSFNMQRDNTHTVIHANETSVLPKSTYAAQKMYASYHI